MPTDEPQPRVVGLHRRPFDFEVFEKEMESLGERPQEELDEFRAQLRENWDNAWVVVIEYRGPFSDIEDMAFGHGLGVGEIDWDASYPAHNGPDSLQAPWMEEVLEESSDRTLLAFHLHWVNPAMPLWWHREPLPLPELSPMPDGLAERLPYNSPD